MDRSEAIVQQLSQEVQSKFEDSGKNLKLLLEFLQQYKSVFDDLVEAKKNYSSTVAKYSSDIDQIGAGVNVFPGVAPPTPLYSDSEMNIDSQQLTELGTLISEMDDQKEIVLTQLQKLLQSVNFSIKEMTDTSSQVLIFLSQAIEDNSANGVYGTASYQMNDVNI